MAPRESNIVQNLFQNVNDRVMPTISSLGIKYPTFRDHPLHTGHIWLEGKRADDGAEGLWRIHDSLYDLREFVELHPGGSTWLELTKGTDITEAFESHHLTSNAEDLLPKFFVRKAATPRNTPFTFEQNGFYKTLKRKITKELKNVPKNGAFRSKYLTDLLLVSYLSLAILAVYFRSFVIGGLSGVSLALLTIAAHNFFHQKDNFRMYYFDFSMMPSREWRISHALSHHMYTNTINDLEISSLEPFLHYLPTNKNLFIRYVSWLYSPVIYLFLFLGYFAKTMVHIVVDKQPIRMEYLLPFTVPILMYAATGESVIFCAIMFVFIIMMGSLHFAIVGVNAAHHHPDIFHDGDCPRPKDQMDWGIYQLDAVMDREDITGSHFLVLTNFGDHTLHHLFPTIDHGLLEHLYPVFLETCEEFNISFRMTSQIELIKGQFKQLARTEPKKDPPRVGLKYK